MVIYKLNRTFALGINKIDTMVVTKEDAMKAFKKALAHKKEAKEQFERWLRERGVEGKVVTL